MYAECRFVGKNVYRSIYYVNNTKSKNLKKPYK